MRSLKCCWRCCSATCQTTVDRVSSTFKCCTSMFRWFVVGHFIPPMLTCKMQSRYSALMSLLFRPHCSTTCIDAAYCYRPSRAVCLSVTVVTSAKTAELIEMPFGLWTPVGPRNHVLDGVQITLCKGAIFWGKDMPAKLSPLTAADVLVRCLRCSGIIACGGWVHLSPWGVMGAGEYDSTVRVRWWCGLLSGYFDHLF